MIDSIGALPAGEDGDAKMVGAGEAPSSASQEASSDPSGNDDPGQKANAPATPASSGLGGQGGSGGGGKPPVGSTDQDDDGPKAEEVSAEQVLQQTGLAGPSLKLGSFTQRAGLKLAGGVGALGIVVTLLIVYKWISMIPASPDIGPSLTKDQVDLLTGTYKIVHEQALDASTKLFDAIVTKALLPVFTAILGYIFGARSSSENPSSGS